MDLISGALSDRYDNICFVKTGWSERFQGGPVFGRHDHLRKFKSGHEALNFMPGPDGRFYVYVPPHRLPLIQENWLVIIVAAGTTDNGRSFCPLEPVGWLQGADFVAEKKRPEYRIDRDFPLSADGTPFNYSVVASDAVLIPVQQRQIPLPREHGRKLGMSSLVIVREKGEIKGGDLWRRDYADYALKVVERFPLPGATKNTGSPDTTDPSALAQDPTANDYPTAEHRRRVEKAAESIAFRFFEKDYVVQPVMAENRGYDFHMKRRDGSGTMLLEIKGTSGKQPAFYLTANEMRCLRENPDNYRIFVVTSALSNSASGRLITPKQLEEGFAIEPLAWRITPKG